MLKAFDEANKKPKVVLVVCHLAREYTLTDITDEITRHTRTKLRAGDGRLKNIGHMDRLSECQVEPQIIVLYVVPCK